MAATAKSRSRPYGSTPNSFAGAVIFSRRARGAGAAELVRPGLEPLAHGVRQVRHSLRLSRACFLEGSLDRVLPSVTRRGSLRPPARVSARPEGTRHEGRLPALPRRLQPRRPARPVDRAERALSEVPRDVPGPSGGGRAGGTPMVSGCGSPAGVAPVERAVPPRAPARRWRAGDSGACRFPAASRDPRARVPLPIPDLVASAGVPLPPPMPAAAGGHGNPFATGGGADDPFGADVPDATDDAIEEHARRRWARVRRGRPRRAARRAAADARPSRRSTTPIRSRRRRASGSANPFAAPAAAPAPSAPPAPVPSPPSGGDDLEMLFGEAARGRPGGPVSGAPSLGEGRRTVRRRTRHGAPLARRSPAPRR